MLVVVDWWESLRRVPPKEAIVALVSNVVDILAAVLLVEERKCLESWVSREVIDVVTGEGWRVVVRNRIRRTEKKVKTR